MTSENELAKVFAEAAAVVGTAVAVTAVVGAAFVVEAFVGR